MTDVSEKEKERFRSFAERYVVERAGKFGTDSDELEDAWKCVLKARTIYQMIAQAAAGVKVFRDDDLGDASVAAMQNAMQSGIGVNVIPPPEVFQKQIRQHLDDLYGALNPQRRSWIGSAKKLFRKQENRHEARTTKTHATLS